MKLKKFFEISGNANESVADIYINNKRIMEPIKNLMRDTRYAEAKVKEIYPYPISDDMFGLEIEVEFPIEWRVRV